jgi:hypothetical protein
MSTAFTQREIVISPSRQLETLVMPHNDNFIEAMKILEEYHQYPISLYPERKYKATTTDIVRLIAYVIDKTKKNVCAA